ncbi:DoxX family protein [Aquimarina intermedia]|uniref:DoxX-like protein n=1 Tax=Aquimarina intermedia TaxID=350814 RepID=A0A5S5BYZ8_9FLAO|nr:DoxX family protein [Aquimarina intermedia]TYP71432.1 DoxX-like protein [Aquimarina intermedia]
MEYVLLAMKLIVSLSILNVWLIQYNKPTRWRGGNAKTIVQEFHVYGLPTWFCYLIGMLKIGLAILLLLSIWYPELAQPSALGLSVLLIGSIIMHLKIKDPLYKSLPAFVFLSLSLIIAFYPF